MWQGERLAQEEEGGRIGGMEGKEREGGREERESARARERESARTRERASERKRLTSREDSIPLICLLPMHTSPTHPHACPRTNDSGDRSCQHTDRSSE